MTYKDSPVFKWHYSQELWHARYVGRWHTSQKKWHTKEKWRGIKFSEIVSVVFHENSAALHANIMKTNPLFSKLIVKDY